MFDRAQFENNFEATLLVLANAEKITKDTLRDLSRDLLTATHQTQDIAFINRTLDVLSRRHREVCVLFFKEFSGFKYSQEERSFAAKDKKNWDKAVANVTKQLEDPHFNVWTWDEKANDDIQKKKFNLADVTKFAEKALKKAAEEGIAKTDVFKAFIEGGFEAEELVVLLQAMANEVQGV